LAQECEAAIGVQRARLIAEEARELMSQYRATSVHIAGILRSGRSPGALVIRG
jgi:hypothetical protein